MRDRCLSVVVPVYNEEKTIATIVDKLVALPRLLEIVVIDDCSTDNTPAILETVRTRHPELIVMHHDRNWGKTEALKTGFRLTRGDVVIVQDADLEYDPQEIPEVIAPILEGNADVVFGSRFLVRKAARCVYFYHYLGNKLLTLLSNLATNINLTDVETCYKAFRGDIIRNIRINSSGFGFEIEVTAKVAKLRCAIYEGAHQLLRPHLRGRQEDHRMGRPRSDLLHPPIQPVLQQAGEFQSDPRLARPEKSKAPRRS